MKALIAMSGGVDSSMAAMLAMEAGYECVGCTMELFDVPGEGISGSGETASAVSGAENASAVSDGEAASAVSDAKAVADKLGMEFHAFDLRSEFRSHVIDDFVCRYAAGRTPNPCIVCNRTMKFGVLLEKAREIGCDKIVTGHYARICRNPETGLYSLKKGVDHSKDQSYVLYHLSQEQLSNILFPLGEHSKDEVRALAQGAGFAAANRPESQDICFVPNGDYAEVLQRYAGIEFPPGDFVDLDGNVMGIHKGIIHYTIGQHKRLGQAFGIPRYVCAIDGENNRVTLGGAEDVFSSTARLKDCSLISGRLPEEMRCKVRLRYKQNEQWAMVRPVTCEDQAMDHEGSGFRAEVTFDEPQRAITPGQAAVFYDGDTVLGGGTIV